MSYFNHNILFPLKVPSSILEDDTSTVRANYISEYFFQKYSILHRISDNQLAELIPDVNFIPENIFELIDHPDNTDNENLFLINVFSSFLDFVIDIDRQKETKDLESHQFINLIFTILFLLKPQTWDEKTINIFMNHPQISEKMLSFFDTTIFKVDILYNNKYSILEVNTLLSDNYSLIPLQKKFIEKSIEVLSKDNGLNFAILKLLSNYSTSKLQHLIPILNNITNHDVSTLFMSHQHLNSKEILIDLNHNKSFSEGTSHKQKSLEVFFDYFSNSLEKNTQNLDLSFLSDIKFSILAPKKINQGKDILEDHYQFQKLLSIEYKNPEAEFAFNKFLERNIYTFLFIASNVINARNSKITKTELNQQDYLHLLRDIIIFFENTKFVQNYRTDILSFKLDNEKSNVDSKKKTKI